MKKTKRVVPALILSLVMMVLVTACGSNAPIAEKDGDSSSVQPADAVGENTAPMTTKLLPSNGMAVLVKYNAKGQKILETEKSLGKTFATNEFEYDEHGNVIKTIIRTLPTETNPLESKRIAIHKYNSDGKIMETTWYKDDGITVESVEKYACDDNGNIVKTTRYNGDGTTVTSISTHEYDEHGNESLINYYAPDEVEIKRTVVKQYDEHGNLLSEQEDILGTHLFLGSKRNEYRYDSSNNLINRVWYTDGEKFSEYDYYANGQESRFLSYSENELSLEVIYNEQGYQTKLYMYMDGYLAMETTFSLESNMKETLFYGKTNAAWGESTELPILHKVIEEFNDDGSGHRKIYDEDGNLISEEAIEKQY